VTTVELDAESERILLDVCHVDDATREDLHPVATHLGATDGREFQRWHPLMAEIAVHVRGGSVARLPGVDDDYRATLAAQLEGTGQSSGRSPDDGDIAVSLNDMEFMFSHDLTIRSDSDLARDLARFARNGKRHFVRVE
jgi:hypothetical protein